MPTFTIFALSTPPGRSALAVIRISGPGVGAILDAMATPRPKPRFAALRRLIDPATGDILDEAIVLYFAAPKTETGEDMAEFQVHGGKAIVRVVLDALANCPGTRPAEPGEFASRAFANGKLDLAQIEGLADLIDAETQGQRQQAIAQATGLQSKRFDAWRDEVLRAMGLVEAAIDFSDEADVSDKAVTQAERAARTLRASIAAHLDDGHRGEILRDGFRVVLAGPPNVGKSSLLNALARRDAAIVSAEPGTTRDVIDVRLDLEGHAVIVSDTAGIRETSSTVEQEGIRRTLEATRNADLVLWLTPTDSFDGANIPAHVSAGSTDSLPPHRVSDERQQRGEGLGVGAKSAVGLASSDDPSVASPRNLTILTKSDLLSSDQRIHVKHPPLGISHLESQTEGSLRGQPSSGLKGGSPSREADHAISAKTGDGLDGLIVHIAALAREAAGNASDPAITRVRHRRELEAAIIHIDAFLGHPDHPVELRAEDLRLAATALGRLTGRIDAEEVLGEIFSRFCIGK